MGLDMYLSVRESISNWNFDIEDKGNNDRFTAIVAASGITVKESYPVVEIKNTEIYWRKANQIHGWFVENCGNGLDEGQYMPVSRDKLVELHNTCTMLLDTKSKGLANEMLPPTPGFFFGTYEIDDWYWQDLEHTHKELSGLLERITDENKWDYEIEYYASW